MVVNDLKMSVKIGLGFGILLVVMLVLGGVAIWRMLDIQEQATTLSREYVPEVAVANDVERASLWAMSQMRAFSHTGERSFLEAGNQELHQVKQHLKKAADLAQASPHLALLRTSVETISNEVTEYEGLVARTMELNDGIQASRRKLEESARAYLENSQEYLEAQNLKLRDDLKDRQEKIDLATALMELGSEARILNFKAQAGDETGGMSKAIQKITEIGPVISRIKEITRDEKILTHIIEIEKSVRDYREAMTNYMTRSAGADEAFLRETRKPWMPPPPSMSGVAMNT